MKKIVLSICALVALASCEPPRDKRCVQCVTTETVSHGVIPWRRFTLEVCEPDIWQYQADNNYHREQAQWIGPGPNDSLVIVTERVTECGGVVYSRYAD